MWLLTTVALVVAPHAATTGCATAQSSGAGQVGVSRPSPQNRPLQMRLRGVGGDDVVLSRFRGQPLLIVVFATFDGVCQAALTPLRRFARAHQEVRMVGIAAQPNAEMLADAYAHALNPPFTVTYDPQTRVSRGLSPLGQLRAVPTFIAVGADGRIAAQLVGFATATRLTHLFTDNGVALRSGTSSSASSERR
jgi:hypothetical protein